MSLKSLQKYQRRQTFWRIANFRDKALHHGLITPSTNGFSSPPIHPQSIPSAAASVQYSEQIASITAAAPPATVSTSRRTRNAMARSPRAAPRALSWQWTDTAPEGLQAVGRLRWMATGVRATTRNQVHYYKFHTTNTFILSLSLSVFQRSCAQTQGPDPVRATYWARLTGASCGGGRLIAASPPSPSPSPSSSSSSAGSSNAGSRGSVSAAGGASGRVSTGTSAGRGAASVGSSASRAQRANGSSGDAGWSLYE